VNKRRRINEEKRLRKYLWERRNIQTEGKKRSRYKYVHADGSTVMSLREALRQWV
jgi:hypothetical protein